MTKATAANDGAMDEEVSLLNTVFKFPDLMSFIDDILSSCNILCNF